MDFINNNYYNAPTATPQYHAVSNDNLPINSAAYQSEIIGKERPERTFDGRTDIILIGKKPHLEDLLSKRVASDVRGKNWLFVEHLDFPTDKTFQAQLRQYQNEGIVNRLDVVFPTRTKQNENLESRLLAKSQTVFEWLEGGAEFLVYGNKKNGLANEIASFYIYGDRKNSLLNDIAQVLAEIVAGQEAHSFVSITHLKSNIHLCEDVDLEIGKY